MNYRYIFIRDCNLRYDIQSTKQLFRKWNDGTMVIVINPGSDDESEELKLKAQFPIDTEGHVTMDFWVSESVGK